MRCKNRLQKGVSFSAAIGNNLVQQPGRLRRQPSYLYEVKAKGSQPFSGSVCRTDYSNESIRIAIKKRMTRKKRTQPEHA